MIGETRNKIQQVDSYRLSRLRDKCYTRGGDSVWPVKMCYSLVTI